MDPNPYQPPERRSEPLGEDQPARQPLSALDLIALVGVALLVHALLVVLFIPRVR